MFSRGFQRRIITLVLVSVLLVSAFPQPIASSAQGARVIVEGATNGSAAEAVVAVGGWIESDLPMIDAVIAHVAEDRLDALRADARIVRVTDDRDVELADTSDYSNTNDGPVDVEFSKAAGIQEVWESGDLGQGVSVAILDTGVDPRLPELRGKSEGSNDRFLAYYDAIADRLYEHPHLLKAPGDPNGHGSHVAGIIANSDFEKADGEYRGVAPAANIVAVRVLDENGAGTYASVLRGIQWVLDNRVAYNIRVLNISMYALPVAPYWADPYNLAVMAAWQDGITVVASAGNTGPTPMSVGVPGNTPYVITVGAFTDHRTPDDLGDDYIPEFSAAGPTLDAFVKPDVVAPGAHIVSLMHPNTTLRKSNDDNRISGRYFEMSGSSLSAAMVSGIAALVLSENSDLSPDEVKYRITQTARPQFAEVDGQVLAAYSIFQQGAGRVWAEDAVLSDIEGAANQGMNLAEDLAGLQHYQGWTTYDAESQTFRIIGGGSDDLVGDYTTWTGSFRSWVDGYGEWTDGDTNWSGSFDSWADSFGSWADSFGSWADSFGSWADSFGSWADSFDSWADACVVDPESLEDLTGSSFGSWADSFGSWADSLNTWEDVLTFTTSFGSWADSFGSWADGSTAPDGADTIACEAWAGSFGSWADSYGSWVAGLDSMSDGVVTWTGAFGNWGGGYLTWASSFDSWADSFDSWADGYLYWMSVCSVDGASFGSWADRFDSWADFVAFINLANSLSSWADFVDFVNWVDSFGSWADFVIFINSPEGVANWPDSFGSWADSFGSWADFVIWVNSFGSWADSFGSWADLMDQVIWLDSAEGWADSFDSWADSFGSWADSFGSWADSFDSWADSFGSWADYIAWVDSFGSWADSFDSWADDFVSLSDSSDDTTRMVMCGGWSSSFGSWADSFASWADSFASWADGDPTLLADSFEDWDGGYTTWAGGPEAWSGSFDSWADWYNDPSWATAYRELQNVPDGSAQAGINLWVDLP